MTAAIAGWQVVVAPLFFGANPARVAYWDQTVLQPPRLEEELARALLAEMSPALRDQAVASDTAPADIKTGPARP